MGRGAGEGEEEVVAVVVKVEVEAEFFDVSGTLTTEEARETNSKTEIDRDFSRHCAGSRPI